MDSAKTLLFFLYWAVLITGGILIFEECFFAASIIRALLMPVLSVYLYFSLKPTHSKVLKLYFAAAILLLWLSDIARIFIIPDIRNGVEKDNPLLFFLIATTISNLFFILGFNKIRKVVLSKAVFPSFAFSIGCGLIYFVFFQFISKDYLQAFKTPFIIYIFSYIMLIGFAGNVLDSNTKKRLSVKYFLPAAFLAFLSALLFVFNRYKLFAPRFDLVVTLAYGYAQLLNINGFRKTSR